MRNAPSVVYPVGRCRFYAGLLVALGLLSLAVLMDRLADPPKPSLLATQAAGVLGALLWMVWVGFAAFSWRRSPTGQLHWDAQAVHGLPEDLAPSTGVWRWRSAAYLEGTPLNQVAMVLDLQDRILLRLRTGHGAHTWVWVERAGDPAHWLDLRRALVATRA